VKKIVWLGSSKRDLIKFPKDVIQEVGYAIYHAQLGERYKKARPFKGCGPGVYEVATEYDKNAYRAIYMSA
jgi:phage-related protein